MKVLMLERPHSAATFGGEQVHLRLLAELLPAFGVDVTIATDAAVAKAATFDLVHLWNLQHPLEARHFAHDLAATHLPIALSPIFADLRRGRFAHRAQEWLAQFTGADLERAWQGIATREIDLDGARSFRDLRGEPHLQAARRALLSSCQAVFPLTRAEAVAIEDNIGPLPDIVEITSVAPSAVGDPRLFSQWSGLTEPFVLLPAARIEPNKNQWLTLLALRDVGIPIIVCGTFADPTYEWLCRRDAPANTRFVGVLPPDLLAAAMAAAAICIHASHIECSSLAAMDAAASGTPLVVGDTGSEREIFGDLAIVVDPLDVGAIRTAAHSVLANPNAARERSRRLALHCRQQFGWQDAVRRLASGYARMTRQSRESLRGVPGDTHTPTTLPAPRVHVRGVVLGPSGFAAEGREWLEVLEAGGWEPSLAGARLGTGDCALSPADDDLIARAAARVEAPDIVFHHMLPGHFEPDPSASVNILQTVFEAEPLPTPWVDRVNRADLVLVHTQWNRDCFRRSGVVAPIEVLPAPYRADAIRPATDRNARNTTPFRWLSVFDWQLRKGWDLLLTAFACAFKAGEAELCLKVSSRQGVVILQDFCARFVAACGTNTPVVKVIQDHLDDDALQDLYRWADGFVLPSRGEGFGRPVLEAMLHELPVVASHGSALATLLPDDSVGFPVQCTHATVSAAAAGETPCFAGLSWHEPDLQHLIARMQQVVGDRAAAVAVGQRARQRARSLCDRPEITKRLRQLFLRLTPVAGHASARTGTR